MIGVPLMLHGAADVAQGIGNTYYAIKGPDKDGKLKQCPNFMEEGYKAAGRTVGRLIGGEKGAQVGEKIGKGTFFVVDTALSFVSGKAILDGAKAAQQGTTFLKGTQEVLKATGKNLVTNVKGTFNAIKSIPGKVKDTGSNVVKKFSSLFVKDNKAVDNSLTSLIGATNGKEFMKLDLQFFASKGDDAAKEASKVKEVKATAESNYVLFNKTHKGAAPVPKGVGPNGGRLQSHYGLQQQWAKENLAQYGYNPDLAPTVTIETGKGMPHTVISTAQNARRNARVASGEGKWSSSLQDELKYIVQDFTNAGFSKDTVNKVLEQQYSMLDKLKVPYERVNIDECIKSIK